MAEDYLYRYQQDPQNARNLLYEISEEMYCHCLLDLNDILADHRFDLLEMEGFRSVFPAVDTRQNQTNHSNTYARLHEQLYMDLLDAQDPDLLPFNESQRARYGPGGTGKTYLFNSLLHHVRANGDIASSGTAAFLLLDGGRTSHSQFKIPLDIHGDSMCGIKPNSDLGRLIRRCKLIVWDECSMTRKDIIDAVDRTFRDVLQAENLNLESQPFGNVLMVFGGDFRHASSG